MHSEQQQQQQQFIQVFPYLYMALPKLVIQMYKMTSFRTIYLRNNLLYLNFIISKIKAATDLQMKGSILLKRNNVQVFKRVIFLNDVVKKFRTEIIINFTRE